MRYIWILNQIETSFVFQQMSTTTQPFKNENYVNKLRIKTTKFHEICFTSLFTFSYQQNSEHEPMTEC